MEGHTGRRSVRYAPELRFMTVFFTNRFCFCSDVAVYFLAVSFAVAALIMPKPVMAQMMENSGVKKPIR